MLYKYLVPERIDVLRDHRIRFTQPSALNDPFELQSYFEGLFDDREIGERSAPSSRAIEEQYNRLPAIERMNTSLEAYEKKIVGALRSAQGNQVSSGLAEAYEVLIQQTQKWMSARIAAMMDEIGILSLSEDPANNLMWAHYGASHRGFLIGFDESDPFFNRRRSDKDQLFCLRKVVYRAPTEAATHTRHGVEDFFLFKAPTWSYEREQRMLVPLNQAASCLDHLGGKIYLFDFPPRCVRRVVIGAQSSEAFRVEIGEVVGSNPYKHVEVCYAVLNRRTKEVRISC